MISRLIRLCVGLVIAGLCASNAHADTVEWLSNESESLERRIQLADLASQSIALSYFQIRDDNTAGQILAALVRAASRGVTVRVIVDGHPNSNSLPKPLMDYLIEQGVAIRERPVDVRYKVELGRPRDHDKLFIVDDVYLLMGGRNLESGFFGVGSKKYIDQDVVAIGQVAATAHAYFETRWNECIVGQPRLTGNEPKKSQKKQVHTHWNGMPREQAKEEIARWLQECESAPLAACDQRVRFEHDPQEVGCIRFLHDCVGCSKLDPNAISAQIAALISQARCSIDIASPFFAVSPKMRSLITEASNRGVSIRLLTNSLESTDHLIVHAAFANERRWLLRNNVRIFEYQGQRTLHTKLIRIDNRITVVGSHNLDFLSERLNLEVGIVINDFAFAQVSKAVYERELQGAIEVERGMLFRYEARESDAAPEEFRKFRRLRLAAPFVQRFL
jgi:cardiolipin synthase C